MPWTSRLGRRLKLRDLDIVLAVVKAGSMGKAAADLGVSAPVVSKAVADLERALDVRLFERSSQGVRPTLSGQAVLKCGIAVFDDLRQGVKELDFLADPTVGELRVGSTEPLAAGFVPHVADLMLKRHPRVALQIIPADSATLYTRELRQRNVEFAITGLPGLNLEADTDVEVLFDDRWVAVAGPGSKWLRRDKIALADLVNEPWVLPPAETTIGTHLTAGFHASGLDLPRAHVVSFSIPMHCYLLATGRFVSVLPASMLRFGTHLPLRLLPVAFPAALRATAILTLKNRIVSPLGQLFIRFAREAAKAMTGEKPLAVSRHNRRR